MKRNLLFNFSFLLILAMTYGGIAQVPGPARPPDVPFVPTPPEVVEAMLEAAAVTKKDVLYDLGS